MDTLSSIQAVCQGLSRCVAGLVAFALLCGAVAAQAAADAPPPVRQKSPKLVLSGPAAAVSFALIHMVETGALSEWADEVEFVLWRDPDQLRLMALEGKADVLAVPANVAANLYNRGAKLQLAHISTWGILWIVSRDEKVTSLPDLRGQEIAMPFRGDMPDIIFQTVARAQGLDPRRDFRLRYVASPMDAMQLLLARRVDHALLAEPAVSMALHKTRTLPTSLIAPNLYRAVDMQQQWGIALGRGTRIPQAGIAVMGERGNDAAFVKALNEASRQSVRWCQENAHDCAQLVSRYIDMLDSDAVVDAIAASPLEVVPTPGARAELEFLYSTLYRASPAVIGGRMPDERFYQLPVESPQAP